MRFSDLLRPRPPIGSWIMSASPDVAEAMACRGFDFLVIDTEHVPVPLDTILHMARAVEARGKHVVIRLPDHDPARIRWMLDAGLATLMVPMIDTPEQARAVARVMAYPPDGIRGYAAMLRANAYGTDPGYMAEARARAFLIAQLETPAALDALEDIAAVPGVDALFLGPGDISATTGEFGRPTGDATLGRIRDGMARARAAGRPAGTVMPQPHLVREMLEAGAGFAAVASDLGLLGAAAQAALDDIRGEEAARKP